MPWAKLASARAAGTCATYTSAQEDFYVSIPSHHPGNRIIALGSMQGCSEGATTPALTVPEQMCITGSTCKYIKQEEPVNQGMQYQPCPQQNMGTCQSHPNFTPALCIPGKEARSISVCLW